VHKVRRTKYALMATAAVLMAFGLTTGMSSYKSVDVVVDGHAAAGGTYASETVGQFLQQDGIRLADYDLVEPARSTLLRSGMRIVVRLARRVILENGGETPVVYHTLARRVGQLLREKRISLGRGDSVNVSLNDPVQDGMRIVITRRREVTKSSWVTLPFQTERLADSQYATGTDVVGRSGRNGLERIVTRIWLVNGKLVRKRRIVRIVSRPVDEVVDVGTAQSAPAVASRGDASLVTSESLDVVATAYSNPGGYTATGAPAGYGDVAVDPSVIPLGTKLYIPGYGYGIANDTGGAIVGYRIDLCFDSVQQAWDYGRQTVRIYILGRN
jgi:uncharacterized protein YabE (DUF348 family)